MPCRPLKSVDFQSFKTPADTLKALESELLDLAEICKETDFTDPGQQQLFERNVIFIKGYYERFERLVRDGVNS